MTNMPTQHQFKWFGIVMATVCIPFFLLIGSLNTTSGMEFWRSKWHQLLSYISHALSCSANQKAVKQNVEEQHKTQQRKSVSIPDLKEVGKSEVLISE
jgi:hypothetical protein